MTTIATNRNSIACDLQVTHPGGTKLKATSKIIRLAGDISGMMWGCAEAYLGYAGSVNVWGDVINWLYEPDQKPPKVKDIEFLVLTDKKKILHSFNMRNWIVIPDKHFAIGSGMQYAVAAMEAGSTPKESIKIASKFDSFSGMGVKEYNFD